ncbi:MAG TPA: hypothetical protein VFG04_30020 [Planctomycetaceae bacterium]|jgi:hypothetical protein|nr:hypothetical protein [Planctomycetaceae bacterium]
MKLAVPNLKTLDYKQLGIDHGEKLAIAIIGLLLAFVLWSTRWKQPIAESPPELVERAVGAEDKIKKQAWPKGEVDLLKTGADLHGRATALLTPLEFSPWILPIPLNKPYHPDRTLISRPKWLAVKDLLADAQVVDLEMDPKIPRLNDGFKKMKKEEKPDKAKKNDKKEQEPEEKSDVPDDLKRTGGGEGGGLKGFGGGMGFGGGKRGGMGGMSGGGRKGKDPGERVENKGKRRGRKRKKAGEDDAAAEERAAKREKEKPVGRGYHIVSVRGVFPLREQVAEMMHAMGNAVTRHEAQENIQFRDFKLERQVAKPGPEPWSGPWEPVNREATLEMFHNDVYSFSAETVSDGIIDNHICMPLPVRLIGEWGRLATHPAVKEFALSPEEVQTQLEYQRKVIEKLQAEKKTKDDKIDKHGFAEFTSNTRKPPRKRGAAAEVDENSKPIEQQILDDLAKAPKDRPTEEAINDKLKDYIAKHATPQDHLLLFRYVDFNVEPGKIYRYRVKLVVENPFHNLHAEQVSDPSLLENETLDTEYSEPTRPVYVPEDAKFFVARADARPGRSSLPNAEVDLYQWFASTGTVVNQKITAQIGQLIGGLKPARVLNPALDTADTERVPFSTNDALVDIAPGFSLEPGLHRDLISEIASSDTKDKSEPKEKKSAVDKDRKGGSMVPDVLVFVDENGALRMIDGLDQEEDHQIAKQRYAVQNEQYGDLTNQDDDKGGKLGIGGFGGSPGGSKKKRGGRSPGMPGRGGGRELK